MGFGMQLPVFQQQAETLFLPARSLLRRLSAGFKAIGVLSRLLDQVQDETQRPLFYLGSRQKVHLFPGLL